MGKKETPTGSANKQLRRVVQNAERIAEMQPKRAIVLKSISPVFKAGDTLEKRYGSKHYIRTGDEHPEMIECSVRFGLFGLKKMIVQTPNHYVAAHVENLPSYFKVIKVG